MVNEEERLSEFVRLNKEILFNEFVNKHYDLFMIFCNSEFKSALRTKNYKVD